MGNKHNLNSLEENDSSDILLKIDKFKKLMKGRQEFKMHSSYFRNIFTQINREEKMNKNKNTNNLNILNKTLNYSVIDLSMFAIGNKSNNARKNFDEYTPVKLTDWKCFFEALKENNSIVFLDLDSNKIQYSSLNSNSEIKNISNYETKNDDKESNIQGLLVLEYLTMSLLENNNVTWLDLTDNSIDIKGVKILSKLILKNSSIQVLFLNNNNIDDNCLYILSECLKYNNIIQKLFLSKNKISDIGIGYISDALESNNSIKNISLSNNNISTKGAIILSNLINKGSSLIYMDISDNKSIGLKGLICLAEASDYSKIYTKINLKSLRYDTVEIKEYFESSRYGYVYYFNSSGNEIGYKKRYTHLMKSDTKIEREILL